MILIRALVLSFSALCSLSAVTFVVENLILRTLDLTALASAVASFLAMIALFGIGIRRYTDRREPLQKRILLLFDLTG